ncbi:hypothetical protein E8E15_002184 [Penicillium rubens]|jgi:hypothetical protein|uniref:Uncharacterized protein n=1 Tax=Penicillium rubens (strain ATCC 28089 / DSM 1075 / NRRL 1951 / Wisconsin 54-1255) TaxID=500485 RepID=B6HB88_PENRW|nr:uncharacterized protein N7525_000674 [Penicillium rubens]CAP94544.1 hypothetical protein PCH_Pc18g03200 [Penicillium rubens Wisconsin 54-1255]KAF3020344.1 hypothetical protein E8E15_002184 [Penicillium rubens]KAJ5039602.1 hypothetical protein NUH16_009387 [Penicillium rubens]KAJ5842933.1 hypothetical protein N7525_000674 [Penicillium rubens]KAJ5846486.1 hypothetical protein N7534_010155 [Penicillium rubens]
MADDYHLWEKKGRRLQKWIENYRASGCPYPISTFTLTSKHRDYIVDRTSVHIDLKLPTALNLSNANSTYRQVNIRLRDEGPPVRWIGRTGPGVIFIDDVFRSKRSDDPYISEFTKAAYQMDFPLDSLRNVIVPNVDEVNTLSCLRKVYKSQGLHYPSSTEQTWEPSLPEFNALLGTGIGKIVAAFVLCAWGQGRKRIARIVASHIGADVHKLYMRFDLEDM